MEENKNLENQEENVEKTQVVEPEQDNEVGATENTESETQVDEETQSAPEAETQEESEEPAEEVAESEQAIQTEQEESKEKKTKKIKEKKPKKERPAKPAKKTKAEKDAEKAAARQAEFEGLTDDEVYTKIQTEKLMKRKKKNKLVTLVSLCFAFVIAVSVIIMAAVPVSLNPKCLESGFSRVRLYAGTQTNPINFYEDSDGFEKFEEVYNKAFKQTYINALFTGTLFSYEIEEKYDAVPTIGTLTSNDTYIVYLKYDEDQVLTHQNGKVYESVYETKQWTNKELTFKEVWFNVSKEEGMQETTVYVAINNYPVFDQSGEQTGVKTEKNLVKITIKGNTKEIYDAWDEFEELNV